MEEIAVRKCDDSDLTLLSELNKQLIEDEKFDTILETPLLKERMRGFIHSDYSAFMFYSANRLIGYALVNIKQKPYYIRHFFICRDLRRHGFGRKAFFRLLAVLNTDTVDLEVLSWNERGIRFWNSLGFMERSKYMRLECKKNKPRTD